MLVMNTCLSRHPEGDRGCNRVSQIKDYVHDPFQKRSGVLGEGERMPEEGNGIRHSRGRSAIFCAPELDNRSKEGIQVSQKKRSDKQKDDDGFPVQAGEGLKWPF